jgi:restriction endonuclease
LAIPLAHLGRCELDVTVEIPGLQHHVCYGTLTICECKNWSSPVSWDELATFREKLKARNCSFGIFIALNGVTAGFREKLKAYLRDGVVIALLTKTELRRLEQRVEPEAILKDAYYATRKYEGEAKG